MFADCFFGGITVSVALGVWAGHVRPVLVYCVCCVHVRGCGFKELAVHSSSHVVHANIPFFFQLG